MDQRVAFIADWLRDEWTMTELAARYGISRKTAYKWVDAVRGRSGARAGASGRARPQPCTGARWPRPCAAAMLALRRAHPTGGRRSCGRCCGEREPRRLAGAEHDGRSAAPRGAEPAAAARAVHRAADAAAWRRRRRPNDVWTADFKGWFRTRDGTRCDPLTVADACSRFVLCCRIVRPERAGRAARGLSGRFATYGLPRALRTDNGSPFATRGRAGCRSLAVWWLKLGIQLDRIDPGHPEQNGRHERFHLTLQQETTTPPARDAARSSSGGSIACGANSMRSGRMKRLGQTPPARVYVPSPRALPRAARGPVV